MIRVSDNMKNRLFLLAVILLSFISWSCHDPEKETPDVLIVSGVVSNVSAFGGSDGYIDLTVGGGTQPYSFQWSTGAVTEDIDNLHAGSFVVLVSDAGNQEVSDTFVITQPEITLSDSLIDYDGNRYSIVKIGEQFWMGENLKVTHAPDGKPVTGYAYGNDENNVAVYGRLYTWDVAMNGTTVEEAQGICPCGWHVPSDEEFKILEMELGMTRLEADMENIWRGSGVGTSLISGGASGYNAVLAGRRSSAGDYYLLGVYEYMWTSTEFGSNAWRRCLDIHSDLVGRWNTFPKSFGFSVRCVKDNE